MNQSLSMQSWENIQALCGNLMAAEDLTIVFDANIKEPAHIDLKHRIIRVAQLVEDQRHLIPGLVAHEVAHAIWTRGNEPVDPILNIIEDGYIERMVSKKYPGSKKHLRKVFNQFFVDDKDEQQPGSLVIQIINIMNYNCKGIKFGLTKQYPTGTFPEDIKFFQKEVEQCNLDSLKKRAKLAKATKKILKKYRTDLDDLMDQLQKKMAEMDSSEEEGEGQPNQGQQSESGEQQSGSGGIDWNDDDDDDDDDSDGSDDGESEDGEGDASEKDKKSKGGSGSEDGDSSGDNGDDESAGENSKSGKSDTSGGTGGNDLGRKRHGEGGTGDSNWTVPDDEPDDTTWLDDHLAEGTNGKIKNHHDQFDTVGSNSNKLYLEIASPEAVYAAATKVDIFNLGDPRLDATEKKRVSKRYTKDINNARKVANIMYQKFLITKNASELSKVQYERSGTLDINRLVNYKTSDDIFITHRITPEGKNHGLVVLLDWSGSMSSDVMKLWARTSEFVEFARLADVRVVVHTFTTQSSPDKSDPKSINQFHNMVINHGRFIKVVDTGSHSRMEVQTRLRKFWNLCISENDGTGLGSTIRNRMSIDHSYQMSGTNIVEGHAFASYVASRLGVEKASVVVVADGDDSSSWCDFVDGHYNRRYGERGNDRSSSRGTIDTQGGLLSEGEPDSIDNMDNLDMGEAIKTIQGAPLPEMPRNISGMMTDRYMHSRYTGERYVGLLAQVREAKKQNITTIGIFLGSIRKDMKGIQSFPYEGNLVEWQDMAKGNAFIGQLIDLIS